MEHDAIETRRRRALFRATHRGTKEMDWMVGKFAQAKLGGMGDAALNEFEKLLSISDPELNKWIISPEQVPDRQFAPLIDAIRSFHGLDDVSTESEP